MRKILTFDIPEDMAQFTLHDRGPDLYCVLCDLDMHLRDIIKYQKPPLVMTGHDYLDRIEQIRAHLYALMDERSVSFDMVE